MGEEVGKRHVVRETAVGVSEKDTSQCNKMWEYIKTTETSKLH